MLIGYTIPNRDLSIKLDVLFGHFFALDVFELKQLPIRDISKYVEYFFTRFKVKHLSKRLRDLFDKQWFPECDIVENEKILTPKFITYLFLRNAEKCNTANSGSYTLWSETLQHNIREFEIRMIEYAHDIYYLKELTYETKSVYFAVVETTIITFIPKAPTNPPIIECIACIEVKSAFMFEILYPCSHRRLCMDCEKQLKIRTCPLCRAEIKATLPFKIEDIAEWKPLEYLGE